MWSKLFSIISKSHLNLFQVTHFPFQTYFSMRPNFPLSYPFFSCDPFPHSTIFFYILCDAFSYSVISFNSFLWPIFPFSHLFPKFLVTHFSIQPSLVLFFCLTHFLNHPYLLISVCPISHSAIPLFFVWPIFPFNHPLNLSLEHCMFIHS